MKRHAGDLFLVRYPVSIAGIIVGLISFQMRHADKQGLEPPLTKAIRGLAEAAGFTYGHLRTILSIWKKEGLLESFGDEKNLRWTLGSRLQSVIYSLESRSNSKELFSFVIFSFTTEETRKRRDTREILKQFNCRMFAPNVYVNAGIDRETFDRVLGDFGLQSQVFLFETVISGNKPALERIRSLWDLPGFLSTRKKFIAELERRLASPIASDEDAFFAYQFCSISHHEHILQKTPALPLSFFPDDFKPDNVAGILARYEAKNLDLMTRYYRRINQEGVKR